MRKLLVTFIAALALVLVPAVLAGGWATVKLSSTPTGIQAGKVWNVRLTVLQHGRTPLAGVIPAVRISQGAQWRTFKARPTASVGVYRARVVFPAAGRWAWEIDDGFGRVHTFADVRIARS
jgi:hypothetical protein